MKKNNVAKFWELIFTWPRDIIKLDINLKVTVWDFEATDFLELKFTGQPRFDFKITSFYIKFADQGFIYPSSRVRVLQNENQDDVVSFPWRIRQPHLPVIFGPNDEP